jgi:hypothetical protein
MFSLSEIIESDIAQHLGDKFLCAVIYLDVVNIHFVFYLPLIQGSDFLENNGITF